MASPRFGTRSTPGRPFLRRLLGGLLAAGLCLVAWVALHLTGTDARPASGIARSAAALQPGSQPRVRYYLQQPPSAGPLTETVALLASLGRPASDFNELVAVLVQAGYRTVCVESRGVGAWAGGGLADAQLADLAGDIQAALADAGVGAPTRVHVVGHAFGNRVARTFATLHPEQTASVVLVAAGDKTDLPPDLKRALALSALGFLPWAWREDAVSRAFFAPGNSLPEHWQHGWSAWGAMAQARAAQGARRGDFHDGGQAQMLVLQGEDDVIAPAREAGDVLKAAYGDRVSLVRIANAGHAMLPEQPGKIAEALLSFLRAQRQHAQSPTP
ncbi:MAG TPA: alpha/beta hydrolase [Ideonella sp.]|nr:alpha/beta hydrolase [Ideonella sp.]